MTDARLEGRFRRCFDSLAAIGAGPSGWNRFAWTEQDRQARAWFTRQADSLGLTVEQDRDGNCWAWWGTPASRAAVTGSHLDTVPDGGAFDGALGVVAAFLAVEELQRLSVRPSRPVAVVVFADEEGARFNTPTFGSRLLTGSLAPAEALDRVDGQGIRLRDAITAAGHDPGGMGSDPEQLARIGVFVELHIEQGRRLADLGRPLALCERIWPHGRWRLDLRGVADHAGTTRLDARRDPVMVVAAAITAAREAAAEAGGVATIGRLIVEPNATNAIAERAQAWLDARAPDGGSLERLVASWEQRVTAAAGAHGVTSRLVPESRSGAVTFDQGLRARLAPVLAGAGLPCATVDTAAGHDAGVLAGHVPAAMLFVRNPTGVSHSARERAELADCVAGVRALAAVLGDLVA